MKCFLYMLWKECMSQKFYQHICKEKNFCYLNGENVLQPKVTKIINEYLNEDTENYNEMRNNLSQFKNIFQCVYWDIFLEIYSSTERQGFNLKSSFHIMFQTYKDKKKWECSVKTPEFTKKYVMRYPSTSKSPYK